jgi:hypothetical protein
MLYSVFLQIPENDIDTQKLVWKKLKTVQKIVLFDNSKYVRKKNKMAAIISIFGMRVSFVIGRSFGQSIFKGTSK